jgi:hypothetical protein
MFAGKGERFLLSVASKSSVIAPIQQYTPARSYEAAKENDYREAKSGASMERMCGG